MSSQRDQDACGAHEIGEAIPGSRFDYTCDDCMLPPNHKEYDESPAYIEYTKKYGDPQDIKKGNETSGQSSKTVPF